jgi:hypothetical protein
MSDFVRPVQFPDLVVRQRRNSYHAAEKQGDELETKTHFMSSEDRIF